MVTLFYKGLLGERLECEGVPLVCLNLRNPFRPAQIRRHVPEIVSFAQRHGAHLVHAHLLASGLYGGLAARTLGIPSVFTAHGELSKRVPLRLAEIAIRHLFATVVGVSSRIESETRRCSLWQSKRRFLHIHNGIDTHFWRQPQDTTQPFPKDGKCIRITMVANFSIEKDHRTAINALKIFGARHANCLLVLAGAGPERDRAISYAEEKGVHNVDFMDTVADIRALLIRTDIFLLASFSEGISIAVLEAMAMGLPVVASDVGGMREIITPQLDGLLVPPGNPEALSEALTELAEKPLLRKSLGQRAPERVASSFSLTAMADAYLGLFHDLVESPK